MPPSAKISLPVIDLLSSDAKNNATPRRFQIVLALEIAAPLRPTCCTVGNSSADPRDEHRQRGERRESTESF